MDKYKATTPATGPGVPTREQIDTRYKWRLEAIYKSDEQWETDFARVREWLPDIAAFQGRLGESAQTLYECFRTRDRILETFGRVASYAHMRRDEDTRVAKYQGMADRIARLATQLGEVLSCISPELLAIEPSKLAGFLTAHKELALYRQHIDDAVRMRPHTLTPREEEIVAMTGDLAQGPYSVFSMLNNADLKFPAIKDEQGRDVEVTKGRYYTLMESTDRRVRHDAFHALYGTYDKYKNTLAATLNSNIKRDLFYARVRKYSSALHAALDGNNIPGPVFQNLIKTVDSNLEPLHRYGQLRKKVLKLDELHPYDMSVPLVPHAEIRYTYEEAVELVKAGLGPMGAEYGRILDEAFVRGWIDVHETEGKRSGAYSGGAYGTQPYILLNFNDTLDSVFTLAHELGHSLHSYLSHRTQPYVYGDYTIFVAEVASTTAESLLMDHMLKTTNDRDRRLYLLNHWVDQIRATFYTQVMFAEFEWQIHQMAERDEPLTHESLSDTFTDLYERYHGPDMVNDSVHRCGWSRIPHFYYNFYVYQYATGYAAATALSQKILAQGQAALDPYLHFLGSGSSRYPIDLLAGAGVDMARPDAVNDTVELFDRLVSEMEDLLLGG
jgi:oligoendopeptidase F